MHFTLAARDDNARIGLVPAAVGGSPISSWEPGALDAATHTHPYDDALARFRADLPFIIGELGHFEGRPWTDATRRVDAAQRAVAESTPNVAYVSSLGLADKGDALHFNSASARALGQRYAAAYGALDRGERHTAP